MLTVVRFVLIAFVACLFFDVTAADEAKTAPKKVKKPTDLGEPIKIFDGKTLKDWLVIDTFDFMDHGKVEVKDGVLKLQKGQPATGVSYKKKLPKSNFEISFKGRRVEGSDFFCGITFPVKESYCTLILGGWGGSLVGLSNIDDFSAAENETTQVVQFKNGKWYDVRIRVMDEFIRIWIDKKKIIDVETKNRKFSIWWEQEPVRPLGIVSWFSSGELKDLTFHKVKRKK